MPLISVAIVSFNTRDMLRECLLSLQACRDEAELEVIVVDNNSRDGSAAMVRQEFPQVLVIEEGQNLGFGAANNRALDRARGDLFWLLNSDTAVEPGTISVMLDWMRSHSECGAIGARLILRDGSTQPSCALDPSLWAVLCEQTFLYKLLPGGRYTGSYAMTNWSYSEARDVPQVCGASLLMRSEAWRAVGGFDENYFMYFEDTDLCVRLREAGWAIWYLPEARVRHFLGASSQNSLDARASMILHYNRGRLIFFSRRRSQLTVRALRTLLSLGALGRLLAWTLLSLRPRRAQQRPQRSHARAQMRLFRAVWNATRRLPLRF